MTSSSLFAYISNHWKTGPSYSHSHSKSLIEEERNPEKAMEKYVPVILREQKEMQSLGFIGIFKESFKLISSSKKLFAGISLALILPFSFILLALSWASQFLSYRIIDDSINRMDILETWSPIYSELTRSIRSNSIFLGLSTVGHYTAVLFLSMVSTFTVAYTVTCLYTGKGVTFRKVVSVVPRVWKGLAVTFLWSFAVFLAYNVIYNGLVVVFLVFINPLLAGIIAVGVLSIIYIVGFVYVTMIWQLACVVSVLEDVYGRKAIAKSKVLMKGKKRTSVGCFIGLLVLYLLLQMALLFLVAVNLVQLGLVYRIFITLFFVFILLGIVLLALVVQTVLYFVCKSFHHENIEPSFVDHLEVQIEQIHV